MVKIGNYPRNSKIDVNFFLKKKIFVQMVISLSSDVYS